MVVVNRNWLNMDVPSDKGDANREWKPKLGMVFEGEQAAYDFYNSYGRRCGFSIRKEVMGKNKHTGEITSRIYVCSKEGVRSKTRRDQPPKNARADTRCGCDAHMGIKLNRSKGKYEIYTFKEDHNHPLVPSEFSYMLVSQRRIAESQGTNIDLTEQPGIPLQPTYELFGKQSGGKECLGFTKLDRNNYLPGRRQKNLVYGEAGRIHAYFKRQSVDNPLFYYDIQFDSDELFTNMFWADAMMIIDYELFGDVVCFDTTYKINEEHRPFAVFVGFNHHRETVVFGAALLYDETVESFKWLFRTFLEVMSNKQPKTILTDQDAAMSIAVAEELPSTFHRLCKWHIMQNALKHTRNTGKSSSGTSSSIKSRIAYFMDNIDDEIEFLEAWDQMLEEYAVQENRWLKTLFDVRKKWAHCYVSYEWSAGLKSTQLSGSFNACLKNYLKSYHDVVQFFMHFERVVADKRNNELNAEYNLYHRMPRVDIRVQMVVQAGQIYTKQIFEEFQEEYVLSIELIKRAQEEVENGNKVYTVGSHRGQKVWYVTRNVDDDYLSCTCRRFDTRGIICRHAIKILRDELNVFEIPATYILKRWTRDARSTTVCDMHGRSVMGETGMEEAERFRNLCKIFTKIAYRAAQSKDAYRLALETSYRLLGEVEGIIQRHMDRPSIDADSPNSSSIQAEESVEDAPTQQARGLKKRKDPFMGKRRKKSMLEKASSRRRRSAHRENTNETSQSSHTSQSTQRSSSVPVLDGSTVSPPIPSQSSQTSQIRPYMTQNYARPLCPPLTWMSYPPQSYLGFQPMLQQNLIGWPHANSPASTQGIQSNTIGPWINPPLCDGIAKCGGGSSSQHKDS